MRMNPIAIVGLGSIFPGSSNVAGFWKNIVAGRDLMSDVPATHWLIEDYYDPDPNAIDKTYCKRGAFLPEIPFDCGKYGIPPSTLPSTDTSQLLGLIVAEAALIDATQGQFPEVDRERISVILGNTGATELFADLAARTRRPRWEEALRAHGLPECEVEEISREIAALTVPWTEASFPGLLGNVVAGRIANRLDLHGTNCVVDAACASSLAALNMGIAELMLGAADMVLVGGIDTMNDPMMYMCFSKTPALSLSGDCRPFSDDADGTMLGEGVAMVALRRLEDAERDGNQIYAVIRGVGSASDGKSKSVYAPVREGQARALRRAYRAAGYGPETVELVEAHGTATKTGDVAEFSALKEVFEGADSARKQWCALGSVKSQIGHTKCTAGIAGLLKAVLALHHEILPPTIKVKKPNEVLQIEQSPFYLNTEARPWIRTREHPRRASVSAFGFGGSNFHVTLEEYCGTAARPPRFREVPTELFVWSAETPQRLQSATQPLRESLERNGGKAPTLAMLAMESQSAFDSSLPSRLAIVARDCEDLQHKLTRALQSVGSAPGGAVTTNDGIHYEHAADSGQIAFVFAGQGSQYVNMGRDLAIRFDVSRNVWDRAAGIDSRDLRLQDVVFPPPTFSQAEQRAQDERIRQPEWSQPAIAVCALSQLAILQSLGIEAGFLCGHSFGEWVALYQAGVLDEKTLLQVSRKRGELMGAATSEETSMTAVFASPDAVAEFIARTGDVVIANYNGCNQTVISGSVRSLVTVEGELKENKIHFARLPVGAAFHSPFMRPAGAAFGEYLKDLEFHPPKKPVFASSTAQPYGRDTGVLPKALADQIHEPVRFEETIRAMYEAGCRTFIEIGPGSALTRLVTDILAGNPVYCISMDRRGDHGITVLWQALARLAVLGVPLQFPVLWEGVREDTLESSATSDPKHVVRISGANYGRPYPPRSERTIAWADSRRESPANGRSSVREMDLPERVDESGVFDGLSGEIPSRTAAHHRNSRQGSGKANASAKGVERAVFSVAPGEMRHAAMHEPETVFETAQRNDIPMANGADGSDEIGKRVPDDKGSVQEGWLRTLQQLEQSTTAAEKAFQEALKQSYDAYLEAMQTAHSAFEEARRPHTLHEAGFSYAPSMPNARAEEMNGHDRFGQTPAAGAPLRKYESDPASLVETPPPASALARPDPAEETFEDTLLGIVSEKTGYPKDVLDLDTEIEAGLGIDSIKRVEIFSALQTQMPDTAKALNPTELLKLATLREVLRFLGDAHGTGEESPGRATEDSRHAAPVLDDRPVTDLLGEALLGIVSEKTGYPKDVLDLDTEIEAGLGIDSIKRVEIFSALQTQMPETAKALDPAELLKLGTFRDVLQSLGGGSSAPSPADPPADRSFTARAQVLHDSFDTSLFRGEVEALESPPAGLTMAGLLTASPLTIVYRRGGDFVSAAASCLANRLRQEGLEVRVSADAGTDTRGIIILDGLHPTSGLQQGLELNESAFSTAKGFARNAGNGGVFITVQDTGGSFGLAGAPAAQPWLGGLAGLAKVAALEWPGVYTKAIDLEVGGRSPEAVSGDIAAELLYGGPEQEVGIDRQGYRRTVGVRSAPLPPETHGALDENAVMVVSGGARGVACEALMELVREHPLRLVLLGRTVLEAEPACCATVGDGPSLTAALIQQARADGRELSLIDAKTEAQQIIARREITRNLSRFEHLGAQVRYAPVDVLDERALKVVLDDVRRTWGPVRALVHAAGVVQDKLIRDKTLEQFRRVMRTKVVGLHHLLEATRQDPLSLLCVFSSIAARYGNVGQCDYAMANEIMNKVAGAERQKRGGACVVKSINWGPWEAGMVTPELKTHFEKAGVPLILLKNGARAFVNEAVSENGDSAELVIREKSGPVGERNEFPGTNRLYGADLVVTRDRFPFLDDHRIQGCPVLPIAIVLELFARMSRAVLPELILHRIYGLRVLSGLRLTEFPDPCLLRIHCRKDSSSAGHEVLALELSGGERRYYEGAADLFPSQPSVSSETGFVLPSNGHSRDLRDPYRDVLFHGPSFRVIESLAGVNAEGARARLSGTADKAWPGGPWLTDPAALDGGLQLARIWVNDQCGFESLPMGIGEFSIYQLHEPIAACELRPKTASSLEARVDLMFVDAQRHLVSEMHDVIMTLQPGAGTAATR